MSEIVTDAGGKKITVQQLDPGEFLDLLEAVGAASTNSGYVGYSSIIAAAREIDGVPLPFPIDKKGIKAAAKRLGNAGIAAVSTALGKVVEDAPDTLAAAGN